MCKLSYCTEGVQAPALVKAVHTAFVSNNVLSSVRYLHIGLKALKRLGSGAVSGVSEFEHLVAAQGPAVWALRAQTDKHEYAREMRRVLEAAPNLAIREGMATGLELDANGGVAGVRTFFGITFRCRAAVLTTGTFMNGRIWVGRASMPAGRFGLRPGLLLPCVIVEKQDGRFYPSLVSDSHFARLVWQDTAKRHMNINRFLEPFVHAPP